MVRYQLRYFSFAFAFGTLGHGLNHRFIKVLEASALQFDYRFASSQIEYFAFSRLKR